MLYQLPVLGVTPPFLHWHLLGKHFGYGCCTMYKPYVHPTAKDSETGEVAEELWKSCGMELLLTVSYWAKLGYPLCDLVSLRAFLFY